MCRPFYSYDTIYHYASILKDAQAKSGVGNLLACNLLACKLGEKERHLKGVRLLPYEKATTSRTRRRSRSTTATPYVSRPKLVWSHEAKKLV